MMGAKDDKYLPRRRSRLGAVLRNPITLWVILVVVFLAIWRLLNDGSGDGSGGGAGHGSVTDLSESSRTTVLTRVLPLGFMVILFAWFRWMIRRVRRFNEEAAAALKLFSSADYAGAADRFADLLRRFQRPAHVRATAAFNLATALLRSGELGRAQSHLSALDPTLGRSNAALRPTVAAQLAAVYALRGEPASADRWIAEAEARAKKAGNPRAVDGALALARAVNTIRRDEYDAAARELATAWDGLEGTLVAFEMRPFRILRAFATTRGEADAASGAASSALADAHPGELAWLGAEWPEMQRFLDAAVSR